MENWCSYKNILVHLLFFLAFYGFDNIFASFHIILFLAHFEGYLKYYQRPVFIGLLRSWSFLVFQFSGLLRSSPGPVSVFCWSQDRTSKHYSLLNSLAISARSKHIDIQHHLIQLLEEWSLSSCCPVSTPSEKPEITYFSLILLNFEIKQD